MTAIPLNTKINGGGSQAAGAMKVLRVRFPAAPLAGIPKLKAFTTGGATPVATQGPNADSTFFNNTDSSVFAITTDDKANAAALNNWAVNLTAGDANNFGTSPAHNPNGRKLNGNASTLQLAPAGDTRHLVANANYGFNIAYRVGTLTAEADNSNNFVTICEYIFTGGVDPDPVWEGNTGTDGAPSWDNAPTASAIAGNDADFLGGSPVAVERELVHAQSDPDVNTPVLAKPASGKDYSRSIVTKAP